MMCPIEMKIKISVPSTRKQCPIVKKKQVETKTGCNWGNAVAIPVSARGTIPGFDRSRNKKPGKRRGKNARTGRLEPAARVRKEPPAPAHRVSATVTET